MLYLHVQQTNQHILPSITFAKTSLADHFDFVYQILLEQYRLGTIQVVPVTANSLPHNFAQVFKCDAVKEAAFFFPVAKAAKDLTILSLHLGLMSDMLTDSKELLFKDPFSEAGGVCLTYPELEHANTTEDIVRLVLDAPLHPNVIIRDELAVLDVLSVPMEAAREVGSVMAAAVNRGSSDLLLVDVPDGDLRCAFVGICNCGNVYEIRYKLHQIERGQQDE